MWKNMVEMDGPQMTRWRTCFACWVTNATDTRAEYAIFFFLFLCNSGCRNAHLCYTNITPLLNLPLYNAYLSDSMFIYICLS